MKQKDILFDMDGCKADFVGGIIRFLAASHPQVKLTREDLNHWDIFSLIPCEVARAAAVEYMQHPDFFFELDPVLEALVAYRRLVELGHNVRICTTPLPRQWPAGRMYSIRAKMLWVRKYLGRRAAANMIFTENKTVFLRM
ncbi:MAG TPA: hypothetical protein PKD79_01255 [Candidatus Doudnabacteria bacterium]|nr:hypothetical protein [Candidatus Doudnabacteria bacterium]